MDSVIQTQKQAATPDLSRVEWAQLRCTLARELEETGDYEAARNAMGELWQRVGERPKLDNLDPSTAAEVLLRAGTLSGWIGSARQIAGAQEAAKDLISESLAMFESLSEPTKLAEARIELAYCYWREGALDEARITLRNALNSLDEEQSEVKALALLRLAIVESSANRLNDALRILTEATGIFEAQHNHSLKGRFHNELASTLKDLSSSEGRDDYLDRALLEYAASSFHFEQAGHTRYRAAVENNLGSLFLSVSRFDEANQHLDRARRLFVSLKDVVHTAQVDKTRARLLLVQQRETEAEKVIRSAIRTLEQGGEHAILAEALTMHGVALARLGQHAQSRPLMERAIELAEQMGDMEGAGRAALSFFEEHHVRLTTDERRRMYQRADELLSGSQHTETLARLRSCARLILSTGIAEGKRAPVKRFVYASQQTAALLRQVRKLAVTDGALLIQGETGTGKEMLARMVHEWSGRAGQFIALKCATLDEATLEAQLLGRRQESNSLLKLKNGPVMMQEAAGGTLYLEEVSELSWANQARMLRLIEQGQFQATSMLMPARINVRVIAASTRDLKEETVQGRLRQDLFYRLSAFQIDVPPLRQRAEDIIAIARCFIEELQKNQGKQVNFTAESLAAMSKLPLEGNARELHALIERTYMTAEDGAEISAEAVETLALRGTEKAALANAWEGCTLEEEVLNYEGRLILQALEAAHGRITRAARLLGMTHQSLAFILNTRHKQLLGARKPIRHRSRSN